MQTHILSLQTRVAAAERKLRAMRRYCTDRDADLAGLYATQEKIVSVLVLLLITRVVAYTWEHLSLVVFVSTVGYLVARFLGTRAPVAKTNNNFT